MGTSTTRSSDPRTPTQKRGNILVLFVVLAMAGAVIYGYAFVNSSKDEGASTNIPSSQPSAAAPAPETPAPANAYNGNASPPAEGITAATPVTKD